MLNLRCGRCRGSTTVDEVRSKITARFADAVVVPLEPNELAASLESLVSEEPSLMVAAGGDGTARAVAAAVAGTSHTLGILPLGTVNHLAHDIGVPLDLESAIDVLADGVNRRIDLGEVNGERFLNVCVLGIYADLVELHERRRQRHPMWPVTVRWLADITASLWRVVRAWRIVPVELRLDQGRLTLRTPLVVIANGPLPRLTDARRLDRGLLAVYVPRATTRMALTGLLARAVVMGPERIEGLQAHHVASVRIAVAPGTRVVVDGEILHVTSPLDVRSLQGACIVRAPASSTVAETTESD